MAELRACSHRFTVDDQGDIGDFLGIQVQKLSDGTIQLTQPQLIDSIIKDLHLQSGSNSKKTPAVPTNLLHKDTEGEEMTPEFHYRRVIGKLNFLEKSTRPDIAVSVHQCARFSELTEFRQPLQVQSHLEMPGILVQLGHTQRT